MNTPSKESKMILDGLQRAVTKELDRKRRLGHYAVIWENGRPVYTEGDGPVAKTELSSVQEEPSSYPGTFESKNKNSEPKDRKSEH